MDKNLGFFLIRKGTPQTMSPGLTWLVLRTFDEFTTALYAYVEEHHEFPPLIVLTSNLDDEHDFWFQQNIGKIPRYDMFKHKSGMNVLSFIMEFSDMLKLPVKQLCVQGTRHTENVLKMVYNKWREEAGHSSSIPSCSTIDWNIKEDAGTTEGSVPTGGVLTEPPKGDIPTIIQ